MSKSDREICEAATDGPWDRDYGNSDSSGGCQWEIAGNAEIHYSYHSEGMQENADADYIARFNPEKITQMLDELEAKDKRIEELEGALMAFIDTCDSGYDVDGCFIEDYSKAKDALK